MSKFSVTLDETMDKNILQSMNFQDVNGHLKAESSEYQIIEVKQQQQQFLDSSLKREKVKRSYIVSTIFPEVIPSLDYSIPNLPSSDWAKNYQAYKQ